VEALILLRTHGRHRPRTAGTCWELL